MIVAPYDAERKYDILLEKVVKEGMTSSVTSKDDDFLLFLFGDTGTGKSSLNMWIYTLYDEEASIDYIGINRSSHAQALQKAKNKKGKRFCSNDEANISRRNHSDQYNKDLYELYNQIRGLNILHTWCNPSADILDRPFIKERIKGFIFIFTKDVEPRPRLYYYFTKKGLLALYDKTKGDLSYKAVRKHAKAFAAWRGWFRKYEGPLWEAYSKKKAEKMDVVVENFAARWGNDDFVSMTMAARIIGVTQTTVKKYGRILVKENRLVKEVDYSEDGVGRYRFSTTGIKKLQEYGKEVHGNAKA